MDGSIIATIMTTHMPRNDAAAPGHVCPGIRLHAMDIVQPPGMGISPLADMDAHQMIVAAALAAKSSAETPRHACWEARSEAIVRSPVPQLRHDNHDAGGAHGAVVHAVLELPTSLSPGCTRRGGATRRPS